MHFRVDADHPSLPGHFPEHPVVPGVVILSHVFAALASQCEQPISGIRRLKFLQQVLPGQTLRLEINTPQAARVGFKCWLGSVLAVEGQVALGGQFLR